MERRRSQEAALSVPPEAGYAIRTVTTSIESGIKMALPRFLHEQEIQVAEAPQETGFDYGVNVIRLAKSLNTKPSELGIRLSQNFDIKKTPYIESVEATGPFINFRVDMRIFGSRVIGQILDLKDDYGKENTGHRQRVVIDMSSPNIAKRMSIGHLRSTIIGDALSNLYKSQGYEVVKDNHLGDWGTQFGKLMVAMKKWGNESELMSSRDPIGILQDLYVKFHSAVKTEAEVLREEAREKIKQGKTKEIPGLAMAIENVSQEIMSRKHIGRKELDMGKVVEDALDRVIVTDLEQEGRAWFLKLEKGDLEARRLWKLCVDLSMKEFNKIYETLGVTFDLVLGESFYENKLQSTIELVRKNKYSSTSDGALVINMEDAGLGSVIVQKSDGASVYFTRDLAGAIFRQKELSADKVVYVVGEDQKLYFQQLFEALRRLGFKIGKNAQHVYFGMISLSDGVMSTREGRVILLKDVIKEGLKRSDKILRQKNPELARDEALRRRVVTQVSIGALKWNDLSQDPKRKIIFDWDKALKLDGNSAPYIQYTAIRAKSILNASGVPLNKTSPNDILTSDGAFDHPTERALVRKLSEYPSVLSEALNESNPSKVASFVYEVAKRFNAFYTNVPVLKTENENLKASRLLLTAASVQVITNALSILGIEVPEKM